MRNVFGLVVATGLCLGMASVSHAQVAVSVNPYAGVSVSTPFVSVGTGAYAGGYYPSPVYQSYGAPVYNPGYGYPGAAYYNSGYGYVAPRASVTVSAPGYYFSNYSSGVYPSYGVGAYPTYGGYYGRTYNPYMGFRRW